MAIIKVRTPTGIEQVRIAGKSPTKEEQQAIISKFFPEKAVTPTPEIDLTKATAEEIEQYKIALEQQGINPKTMKPFQAEDEMSLKDPGVDYMSGLQNFEFRRKLGARDTDEEKEVFLQEQ